MASTLGGAPPGESADPASPPAPAWWEARRLLRAARVGTLATSAQGQPFASLITPACMPDGALLILISRLSEHTRHLMADPRCSILVAGEPSSANPQTTPRVTITGEAVITEDPALKARYLAVHPYAALYAGFTDFATWRLPPAAALLVGGFARAHRLKASELVPDPAAAGAIAAQEADIIARCNQQHAPALAALANEPGTDETGSWRMVTADTDGCDLARNDRVRRIAWSAPVSTPEALLREFLRLISTSGA